MILELDHADLQATIALLRSTHDELMSTRRQTDRQVDLLLDGAWQGRAARAYTVGWTQWQRGCDDVLAALHAMADLIDDHHRQLTDLDHEVAEVFAR